MVLTSRPYCLFSVPHMAPPSRPVVLWYLWYTVRPAVGTAGPAVRWYSRSTTHTGPGHRGTHLATGQLATHGNMVTVGRGCEVTGF